MKKNLSIVLFLTLILSGCELANTINAKDYSNNIVAEQEKVVTTIIPFIEKFNTGDIDAARLLLEPIQVQCDSSINVIEKMGGFKGNDRMQKKALELVHFYRRSFTKDYNYILDVMGNANATLLEYEKIEKIAQRFQVKEQKIVQELKELQLEFAKEHHFEVQEKNPMDEKLEQL